MNSDTCKFKVGIGDKRIFTFLRRAMFRETNTKLVFITIWRGILYSPFLREIYLIQLSFYYNNHGEVFYFRSKSKSNLYTKYTFNVVHPVNWRALGRTLPVFLVWYCNTGYCKEYCIPFRRAVLSFYYIRYKSYL